MYMYRYTLMDSHFVDSCLETAHVHVQLFHVKLIVLWAVQTVYYILIKSHCRVPLARFIVTPVLSYHITRKAALSKYWRAHSSCQVMC